MDKVTLAITLPINGTAYDYQAAIVAAIGAQWDATAQMALSGLLQHVMTPAPSRFNVSGEIAGVVYGKFGSP